MNDKNSDKSNISSQIEEKEYSLFDNYQINNDEELPKLSLLQIEPSQIPTSCLESQNLIVQYIIKKENKNFIKKCLDANKNILDFEYTIDDFEDILDTDYFRTQFEFAQILSILQRIQQIYLKINEEDNSLNESLKDKIENRYNLESNFFDKIPSINEIEKGKVSLEKVKQRLMDAFRECEKIDSSILLSHHYPLDYIYSLFNYTEVGSELNDWRKENQNKSIYKALSKNIEDSERYDDKIQFFICLNSIIRFFVIESTDDKTYLSRQDEYSEFEFQSKRFFSFLEVLFFNNDNTVPSEILKSMKLANKFLKYKLQQHKETDKFLNESEDDNYTNEIKINFQENILLQQKDNILNSLVYEYTPFKIIMKKIEDEIFFPHTDNVYFLKIKGQLQQSILENKKDVKLKKKSNRPLIFLFIIILLFISLLLGGYFLNKSLKPK